MKCDSGLICWFDPGLNTLRLVVYNATFSQIIATFNFTVATTTLDGWGLQLSSNNISTTDILKITVIVPAGSSGTLRIRDAGFSTNTTIAYQTTVTEGTRYYQTSIQRVNINGVGFYEIDLLDASGNVKIHLPLQVNKAIVTTDLDRASEQSSLSIIDSWTAMFGLGVNSISKFLFGLVITIFFIVIGFILTRNNPFGGLIVGVIPYAFFTYIEYFPLWVVVVIFLVIAVRMGWFK